MKVYIVLQKPEELDKEKDEWLCYKTPEGAINAIYDYFDVVYINGLARSKDEMLQIYKEDVDSVVNKFFHAEKHFKFNDIYGNLQIIKEPMKEVCIEKVDLEME